MYYGGNVSYDMIATFQVMEEQKCKKCTEIIYRVQRGHKKWPTYNLIPVQNDRVYNELRA